MKIPLHYFICYVLNTVGNGWVEQSRDEGVVIVTFRWKSRALANLSNSNLSDYHSESILVNGSHNSMSSTNGNEQPATKKL